MPRLSLLVALMAWVVISSLTLAAALSDAGPGPSAPLLFQVGTLVILAEGGAWLRLGLVTFEEGMLGE